MKELFCFNALLNKKRKEVRDHEKQDDAVIHRMHNYWPDHSFIFNFDLSEEKPGYNPGNN